MTINSLPFFHSYDPSTKQLTLRGVTTLPPELFQYADQIEILDAAQGSMSELPRDLPRLSKLKVAFFSQNNFETVPGVLSDCAELKIIGFKGCRIERVPENALPRSLHWLILTDNRIPALPRSCRDLTDLRKVALAGNRLSAVPPEIEHWRELELLRLGANEISASPPRWMFELPKLAWYCDSGNPYSESRVPELHPRFIARSSLRFGERIGGSPTSEVFGGTLTPDGEAVAIKLYKSRFTSDGYARDDIRASVAAGAHPAIVEVLGQLTPDEQQSEGLVLRLVPSGYSTLGLPPSLETCTRDRFREGARFSALQARTIFRDTAAAMAHLHSRRITHGDLYAHNILTDSDGRSILGDFGGASFIESGESNRMKVETRAFGCLIDDLLGVMSDEDAHGEFAALREVCWNPDVAKRPMMTEILSKLRGS